MERYPKPCALAAAPEDEVLALWSGLGYYRRARNLQSSACIMCDKFGGNVPNDFDSILALPGVGRYTAGAIASFAFDLPTPIVEANTARVMARIGAITGTNTESKLWDFAKALLPAKHPGKHNYAIMELGSLVCRPREPLCDRCPVSEFCLSLKKGLVDKIPPEKPKQVKEEVIFAAAALTDGKRYLLRRIPQGEWHAGMMEFPKTTVPPKPDKSKVSNRAWALQQLTALLKTFVDGNVETVYRNTIHFVVTNHRVTLEVWTVKVPKGAIKSTSLPKEYEWVSKDDLRRYPYGTAMKKLIGQILEEQKGDK